MADNNNSSFVRRNFTPRERVLLYALICIIILVGGIYFLILPAMDKHDQAVVSLSEEQDLKIEMETAIATAEPNRQAIGEIKSNLAEVSQYYFEPMVNEEVDIYLSGLAKKHHLTPVTLTMTPICPYGYSLEAEGNGERNERYPRTDIEDSTNFKFDSGLLYLPFELKVEKPKNTDKDNVDADVDTDKDTVETDKDTTTDSDDKTSKKNEATDNAVAQLEGSQNTDTETSESEDAAKNKALLKTPGATTIWANAVFMSLEGDWSNMASLIDEISKTKAIYLVSFTRIDEKTTYKIFTGETVAATPKLNIVVQMLMYQDELGESKMLSVPQQ